MNQNCLVMLFILNFIYSSALNPEKHNFRKLYQCHVRCQGPNEKCVECSGPCFDSCATYRLNSGCPKIACQQGSFYCSCEEGYKRHPVTKKCILACQCPETYEYDYVNNVKFKDPIIYCGGQNEVSGYTNVCANKCGSNSCTKEAVFGCYCQPDFCRNENGRCVPRITN